MLDVPPLGILNVHASLLPRWRGAAPIPAAILAGDATTGATIMKIVRALDAGAMLAKVEVQIAPDDTTATLTSRVAEAGAELLMDVLPRWQAGAIVAEEQDEARATYAPQIEKQDALIDFARDSADVISRKVRAYNPWPMAYSYLDRQPLRFVGVDALRGASLRQPGTIMLGDDGGFAVSTSDGAIAAREVQPSGGKIMPAAAYLRGHRDIIGKVLTSEPA